MLLDLCQSSNWLDRFSGKTDSAVGEYGSQDEADSKEISFQMCLSQLIAIIA